MNTGEVCMPVERGYFAALLKALREQSGLSQAVLAEKCGIGVSTVRQFEYARREPTYETLVRLAEGLGVSLAAFDPPKVSGRPPKTMPATPAPDDATAEAQAKHRGPAAKPRPDPAVPKKRRGRSKKQPE